VCDTLSIRPACWGVPGTGMYVCPCQSVLSSAVKSIIGVAANRTTNCIGRTRLSRDSAERQPGTAALQAKGCNKFEFGVQNSATIAAHGCRVLLTVFGACMSHVVCLANLAHGLAPLIAARSALRPCSSASQTLARVLASGQVKHTGCSFRQLPIATRHEPSTDVTLHTC